MAEPAQTIDPAIVAVNLGRTRDDAELALKVVAPCEETLAGAVALVTAR